jgi:predicted NUDIX family NTP pyrophosphohydrolase
MRTQRLHDFGFPHWKCPLNSRKRNIYGPVPFLFDLAAAEGVDIAVVSSAGILMYRRVGSRLEVLLVHPGGPYWRRKDEGAWSIPKGEIDADEDAQDAARREFTEETGIALPEPIEPLGEIRQRGGKRVLGFALEGDIDVETIRSNMFEIEWPPKSGKMQAFPEIDRAEWFDLATANAKILASQRPLLDRLAERLAYRV